MSHVLMLLAGLALGSGFWLSIYLVCGWAGVLVALILLVVLAAWCCASAAILEEG